MRSVAIYGQGMLAHSHGSSTSLQLLNLPGGARPSNSLAGDIPLWIAHAMRASSIEVMPRFRLGWEIEVLRRLRERQAAERDAVRQRKAEQDAERERKALARAEAEAEADAQLGARRLAQEKEDKERERAMLVAAGFRVTER